MKCEYIDPFVMMTKRVLESAIRGVVRHGDITVLRGERIKGDLAIQTRIAGDAEGDAILSMDAATALGICARLSGEDIAAMTPRSMDALMELANVIMGNAVSALNDQGFDFTVSPPVMIAGGGGMKQPPDAVSLQIPLLSEYGDMTMNVFLGTEE